MALGLVEFAVAFALLFAITSLFCLTRLYIDIERHWRAPSKTHLASSVSFFLGWAFFTVVAGCNFWKINEGLQITQHGRKAVDFVPVADVDYPDVYKSMKLAHGVSGFAIVIALWAVKVSLYLMNFKLIHHLSPKLKSALIVLAIYLLLTFLGTMLTLGLSCQPIERSWDVMVQLYSKDGICMSGTSPLSVGLYAAFNISSDLFVMAVPIAIINGLHLHRHDKWGFTFLLFLGVCTITATTIRSVLRIQLWHQIQAMNRSHSIIASVQCTSNYSQLASYLEISVALVTASLPSMRLKFRQMSESRASKRPKRTDGLRTIGGSGNCTGSYNLPESQQFQDDMEMNDELDVGQAVREQSDHSLTFLTTHESVKYPESS